MNQQPTGRRLPVIPKGFELPFYYASLTNCEVLYLVDLAAVEPYLRGSGLLPANFNGRACVSYNYQLYAGQFPSGIGVTQEIELNIVAYPASQAAQVAEVTFEQFVRGDEQTKILGHHRVHVPCDADVAISAGKTLFGEPKFKTTFSVNLPSVNDSSVETWQFTCNDPDHPEDADHYIFSCVVDVRDLDSTPGNFSPITEYGMFEGERIAARWNILQPFQTYILHPDQRKRVTLRYGSSDHQMRRDMEALIGTAPAAAIHILQSPPVAIQSRAYYV